MAKSTGVCFSFAYPPSPQPAHPWFNLSLIAFNKATGANGKLICDRVSLASLPSSAFLSYPCPGSGSKPTHRLQT